MSSGKWTAPGICCVLAVSLIACTNSQGSSGGPPQTKPSAEAKPAASKQPWEVEWEQTIEKAKKEGEVVIFGQPTTDRESVIKSFEKTYPEIKVKYTGMRPNESAPKILAEQAQGKYLVDVYFEVPPNYPKAEAMSMVRDYIVLPELKADKTWVDGYEKGYELTSNANVYPFAVQTMPYIYINNDVIPKGEIKTFDDLLNPKWKGKIIIGAFDRPAQGSSSMNGLYMTQGEAFVKKLVEDQQSQVGIFDTRQILDNFASGKYPISIGPTDVQVREFVDAGVIKQVTRLEPEVSTVVSPVNIGVLKNPPHPNSTKVFVNWFLGKEAQTAWVSTVKGFLSRRADVKSPDPNLRGWETIQAKYSHHSVEGQKSSDWIMQYGKQQMAK